MWWRGTHEWFLFFFFLSDPFVDEIHFLTRRVRVTLIGAQKKKECKVSTCKVVHG
jgi:hypothetical protein